MSEEHGEKRKFPRLRTERAVHVKMLEQQERESSAKTGSLGAGGCSFVNREPFGTGSDVELLISVKPRKVITARGRVVYERPMGDRAFEVGVEFTSIAPGDREALEGLLVAPNPAGKGTT
jgi:hypothetical protein